MKTTANVLEFPAAAVVRQQRVRPFYHDEFLDFTDTDVRIGNRSDALYLLDKIIGADVIRPDVPLQALRDAIEREIV